MVVTAQREGWKEEGVEGEREQDGAQEKSQ